MAKRKKFEYFQQVINYIPESDVIKKKKNKKNFKIFLETVKKKCCFEIRKENKYWNFFCFCFVLFYFFVLIVLTCLIFFRTCQSRPSLLRRVYLV